MSYRINDKEIENVLALSGADRYEHFVKRVADWEEVWSLQDKNGWVSSENDEGIKSIPVWPHPEYTKLCAEENWKGNNPSSIELQAFIEKWLPGMEKDGLLVAVFPTPSGKGVQVTPAELKQHLQEECEQYE
ncbi:MAG: DUF2750 domain-containing protein [Gammaproteobacteria bacterium]|nr:DUF2750 domain-containing protein [Gammaproteobacteria bacterium]